jgi:hypothetical protein
MSRTPEDGTFALRVLWTLPQAQQSFLFYVQSPEFPDIETDPDEGGLGAPDAVNISRDVTAERKFQPDDDVWKLLQMLAKVPWALDGSDGSRWPVGLVTILNAEFSPSSWVRRSGRERKQRLLNWVQQLMRQNGLDAADLEAVFARDASRSNNGCSSPRKEPNWIAVCGAM